MSGTKPETGTGWYEELTVLNSDQEKYQAKIYDDIDGYGSVWKDHSWELTIDDEEVASGKASSQAAAKSACDKAALKQEWEVKAATPKDQKTWTVDWRMVDVETESAPDGDHDIDSYTGYALVNGKAIKAWGNNEHDGFQEDLLADIAEDAAAFLDLDIDDAEIEKILALGVEEDKVTTIVAKGRKVTIKHSK